MYHRYFGLNEAPFSIAVDPRYLFMSARHKDALAHLLYGVGVGGGFILLTGEVGTGKTTINRCVLEQLPDNTDIALILNPALNAVELLATVCDELDIHYSEGEQSLKVLTDKLHQFLLANYGRGRNTVLLIDEAQHLQLNVLEQIRLLTNLETNNKKLLQIILIGQPELQTLLARRELRQLSQRITARFQLKPLTLEETAAYINHRLQVAGLSEDQQLFPPKVIKAIYNTSGGIPRLINLLCDRMLLGTYGQNKLTVDMTMMRQAVAEVLGEEEITPVKERSAWLTPTLGVTAILLVLLVWFVKGQESPASLINGSVNQPKQTEATTVTPTPPPVISKKVVVESTSLEIKSAPLFASQQQAINALLRLMGVSDKNLEQPCGAIVSQGLGCEQQQVNSWSELKSFNRPAVLRIITAGKIQRYAALIGLADDQALVVFDKKIQTMPLAQLGEIWTGEFNFIWRPDQYETPIGAGSSPLKIIWLAKKFAELDGQKNLLTETTYNEALTQRVTIFQRQFGLQADGIVGLKTVLKLNEQLGVAITLQKGLVKNNPANQEGRG